MNKTKEETKVPLSVLQSMLNETELNKILSEMPPIEENQSLERSKDQSLERSHKESIWTKIKHETEPLFIHCACILVILASLFLIAGFLQYLEIIFPEKKDYIGYIKTLDIWLAFVFIAMFGGYTVFLLPIRLYKSLKKEWNDD